MRSRLQLPRMSMGNWLFWSIIIWVGIIFIWLLAIDPLFSEEMSHSMIWVGVVLGAIAFGCFFKFGPRPKEVQEEED
jgi:drug/metabolite transporter (DMT)-like permease